MDKQSNIAVIAVALLMVATIGATFLYAQNENLSRENHELAVREEIYRSLMTMRSEVQDGLVEASGELARGAALLGEVGLNGTEARAVMNDVLDNIVCSIDVVTIGVDGVIVASEPSAYQGAEGMDISGQEQVQRMITTRMPVMSQVFRMVEGFMASDMQMPIFDADGRFIGSLSVTLDIEGMIRERAEVLGPSSGFQITCLQDDGLEVYDTDEAQIGRNLFTDPAYANYTETLEFMHQMLGSSSGYGTYEYYDSLESANLVTKEVFWADFGMHGTYWTLMFIHVL
jgi:hypothetical protein